MSRPIVPLSALTAADANWVWAKAANLGELHHRGERVPSGVVITPDAWDALLAHNQLSDPYAALLTAARHDRDDLAALAADFRNRLMAATWPHWLEATVWEAVRSLPATSLAVRSSGSLEDSGTTAAAGVFETALHVAPADIFATAITLWSAALEPRVFHHLLSQGLDPSQSRLALLVQAMVPATAAGVLFTVDPLDPGHTTMRLATHEGLGDAVVQGEAGTEGRFPRHSDTADGIGSLSATQVNRLRQLGRRIERAFGRAMDVEWAIADRLVWVLQARPIVDLPPGSEKRPAIRWSRDLAEERFPDPISPLGWTALGSALRVNLDTLDKRFGLQAQRPEEIATVIGGYVYNNRDFFAIPGSMRFRPAVHRPYAGRYALLLLRLLSPLNWHRLPGLFRKGRTALGDGPQDLRFRAITGLFDAYLFDHADRVEKQWQDQFAGHMAAMTALDAEDVGTMDVPQVLDYTRRVIARSDAFMEPDLAIYVVKIACRWILEEIGVLVNGRKDPMFLATLTGGLQANATLAMNAALDALEEAVRRDPLLVEICRSGDQARIDTAWQRSPALAARQAYLRDYGHIGLSWDIRQPTYGEDPTLLDAILHQRLIAPTTVGTAAEQQQLAASREALAARVRQALGGDTEAARFFDRALRTLHTFMHLDEEHHLFCGRLIPAERRIVARLARHLVEQGALAEPDDVHFLTLDEFLTAAAETDPWSRKRLTQRRRLAFDRAMAQRPVMDYHGPVAQTPPATAVSADGRTAKGEPASAGIGEGRVRIVRTMADVAAFRPGDILVTPTPKPSYTPLFAIASALVSARGSTLSHGLISAREYGLPAVTEIHDICERLQDGQRVRVDGHHGTVTVLDGVDDGPP
jgi:pyruvate,water dikinase